MNEPTNLSNTNVDIKVDLTKTVEKAYDDVASNPLKSSGDVASTLFDFFHNTVLYPMQKYNIYAKGKLEDYANNVKNRIENSVPEENQVAPKINIWGPTIDSLKYNLDEEHIKEMFTNILVSSVDNRKQNRVLPSYIEVVKQLSKEDAEFLKLLKRSFFYDTGFYLIFLKRKNKVSKGFNWLSNKYLAIDSPDNGRIGIMKPSNIVLDNLVRLQLINIPSDEHFTHQPLYDQVFEFAIGDNNIEKSETDCSKKVLRITDFGKNFIDICLSES